MYYTDVNLYPAQTGVTLGAASTNMLCGNGFTTTATCTGTKYMERVPTDPGSNTYTYNGTGTPVGSAYTVAFTLEGPTGGLATGAHTASPGGVQ